MSKYLAVAIALAVALAIVAALYIHVQSKAALLESQVAHLKSEVVKYQSLVRQLNETVSKLKSEVAFYKNQTETLKRELTAAKAEAELLRTRLELYNETLRRLLVENGYCMYTDLEECFRYIFEKSLREADAYVGLFSKLMDVEDPLARLVLAVYLLTYKTVQTVDPCVNVLLPGGANLTVCDKWKSLGETLLEETGDCEDYVIALATILYRTGITDLYLVGFKTEQIGHAILIVIVDDRIHYVDWDVIDGRYGVRAMFWGVEDSEGTTYTVYVAPNLLPDGVLDWLEDEDFVTYVLRDVEERKTVCLLAEYDKCAEVLHDAGYPKTPNSITNIVLEVMKDYGLTPQVVKQYFACSFKTKKCLASSNLEDIAEFIAG